MLESTDGMTSMSWLSPDGGNPIRQVKLAPEGVEFSEDISEARWVEEKLSEFGKLRSLLPEGFSAYARVFHPFYLDADQEQPVRWSTVAGWTGRTVHPLMQFRRIANLNEGGYRNPSWGFHPQEGSIPERECRILVDVLRGFTSTPDQCYFCLWEGFGYLDTRLYKTDSRVMAPGRGYLLFRGPIDGVMSFLIGEHPFWGDTPNIWWPGGQGLVCGDGYRPVRHLCRWKRGVYRSDPKQPGAGSAPCYPRCSAGCWRGHHQRPETVAVVSEHAILATKRAVPFAAKITRSCDCQRLHAWLH